jgi:hypothetical protein
MDQHEGGGDMPRKNWWRRRSKKAKAFIILGTLVVIGIAMGSSSGSKGSTNSGAAVAKSAPESAAESIGVKTTGSFARDCFGCGDLADYIDTSDVWCAWKDDKVLVHVTMTNRSVEHVTVTWHPSYTIVGGAEHGAGLTSTEDSGFDAGESRELISEQNPDGIADGAEIGECKPSFFLVKSG